MNASAPSTKERLKAPLRGLGWYCYKKSVNLGYFIAGFAFSGIRAVIALVGGKLLEHYILEESIESNTRLHAYASAATDGMVYLAAAGLFGLGIAQLFWNELREFNEPRPDEN